MADKTAQSPLYMIEIFGITPFRAWATNGLHSLMASASYATNKGLVRHASDGAPALFMSREQADAAGAACRWTGQRYRVVVARSTQREAGRIAKGSIWASCRDGDGRVGI